MALTTWTVGDTVATFAELGRHHALVHVVPSRVREHAMTAGPPNQADRWHNDDGLRTDVVRRANAAGSARVLTRAGGV
ncbi:hypothetical protein [Micromonospora sp. CA-246542]|uniref:hypothetical protein n=1 Tax=Micromonospora sp. CA-246542 TaxID=3239959 RepID=UPI003D9014D1